jgi:hydrogenase nickel incorporation protein HypB
MSLQKVQVEQKVLNENQRLAAELRERFRQSGTLVLNLISAPGSGKTSLLERTLALSREVRTAVLTGDIQTENDAQRLSAFGFPVRQITTGGTCHLDARMIERNLASWNLDEIGLLFIENVGNLVCPSSYDLGEAAKIVLLSVTEGADKPLKYPSIFFKSELLILNKIDLLPYVPFSVDEAVASARQTHPGMEIILTSCTTGAGLDQWLRWVERRMATVARTAAAQV